jgi:hypothetical protein
MKKSILLTLIISIPSLGMELSYDKREWGDVAYQAELMNQRKGDEIYHLKITKGLPEGFNKVVYRPNEGIVKPFRTIEDKGFDITKSVGGFEYYYGRYWNKSVQTWVPDYEMNAYKSVKRENLFKQFDCIKVATEDNDLDITYSSDDEFSYYGYKCDF